MRSASNTRVRCQVAKSPTMDVRRCCVLAGVRAASPLTRSDAGVRSTSKPGRPTVMRQSSVRQADAPRSERPHIAAAYASTSDDLPLPFSP